MANSVREVVRLLGVPRGFPTLRLAVASSAEAPDEVTPMRNRYQNKRPDGKGRRKRARFYGDSAPPWRIRQLVDAGHVSEARKLLRRSRSRRPEQLRRWARALALPETRSGNAATALNMRPNAEWIARHANEHRGWIALRDGVLVAADSSLAQLREKVTATSVGGVLFVKLHAEH